MSAIKAAGRPDRFPVTCPHCAATAGVPTTVTTVLNHPNLVRLDLTCAKCHHKWWQEFATRSTAPEGV